MTSPQRPYGHNDAGDSETRVYNPQNYRQPAATDVQPASRFQAPLSGRDRAAYLPQYQEDTTPTGQSAPEDEDGPALIAGRFEAQRVAVNLTILAVLAGVVSFAAIIISDQLIGFASDLPARAPSEAVLPAILAALTGALAGLLYIPTVGTGNESLFIAAIVALTVAGVVFYIFNDDLIDGSWQAVSSCVAVLAAGITASIAPSRIDAAGVD